MRILITGATGFIGRPVSARLVAAGDTVTAWVRDPRRAEKVLGPGVRLVPSTDRALEEEVAAAEAIVNLAGEPVVGRRWTEARKAALRSSRIGVTESLVRAIGRAGSRPAVLVSGSAVGRYGDRGDERLTEASEGGTDFLAELCRDWERAGDGASELGVRVVLLRTGVVLGKGGGALEAMLPAFRLGAGGPVGDGRQYLPWIHIDDMVSIIETALRDARLRGPVNATAPAPVTSREFADTLGRALHRPAFLPIPGLALRALFGEGAAVLIGGQRAVPDRLLSLGFPFRFGELDAALRDIVSAPAG